MQEKKSLTGAWFVRARERWRARHEGVEPVDRGGDLLSTNQIAGPSWNLPIPATCAPTPVCGSTCYALDPSKPVTWPSGVNRQAVRLHLQETDPDGTAARLAEEIRKRKHPHVVINGSGDLTDNGVKMINRLATLVDVPLWVRSRRPEQAAALDRHPLIFLHFSLDKTSMRRREQVLALRPQASLFFTYQGAPDERIESAHGCALVFAHAYNGDLVADSVPTESVCPLNTLCRPGNPPKNANGACAKCRKCFDGTLVRLQEAISRG
jgi:hypothetical protein